MCQLCIIQNSDEDWRCQAADMGKVYANTFLNISADASDKWPSRAVQETASCVRLCICHQIQ